MAFSVRLYAPFTRYIRGSIQRNSCLCNRGILWQNLNARAIMQVVPEPANGSSTASPGLLQETIWSCVARIAVCRARCPAECHAHPAIDPPQSTAADALRARARPGSSTDKREGIGKNDARNWRRWSGKPGNSISAWVRATGFLAFRVGTSAGSRSGTGELPGAPEVCRRVGILD